MISTSATKTVGNNRKKFEDAELQTLLDENSTQLKQFIEKIQKKPKWVPYELKERDIERRKTICEMLFDRFKRKSFLHRIVTGDEKWIYFDNPKRKKSWVDPGQPSTTSTQYSCKEGFAVYLVGSDGSCVL